MIMRSMENIGSIPRAFQAVPMTANGDWAGSNSLLFPFLAVSHKYSNTLNHNGIQLLSLLFVMLCYVTK